MRFAYRRSRSLLLVSTTGMSVCAERKRLRVRPLNLAIEVLGHEENRDTSDPLTTHSAVSPQQRKRRDLGARSSQQAFKAYKSVSVETTSAVFTPKSKVTWSKVEGWSVMEREWAHQKRLVRTWLFAERPPPFCRGRVIPLYT
jgi:hypothetical protein